MKIFDGEFGRINFVDENNVLVGFENTGDCCETFGYFFTHAIPNKPAETKIDFNPADFVFDSTFFHETKQYEGYSTHFDCGGMVTFKLLDKDGKVVYLNLYNVQNGYYSHGFQMDVGGSTIRKGSV